MMQVNAQNAASRFQGLNAVSTANKLAPGFKTAQSRRFGIALKSISD
jgi:hypothetical protein